MSTMASQIIGVSIVCLTVCSGTYQPFVQAQIKENFEVPRHCMAFVRKIHRGDLWTPSTKGQ